MQKSLVSVCIALVLLFSSINVYANVIDVNEFEGIWQSVESPTVYYSLHVTESYIAGFIINFSNGNVEYVWGFVTDDGKYYFLGKAGFDVFEGLMIETSTSTSTLVIAECVKNGIVCNSVGTTMNFIKVF